MTVPTATLFFALSRVGVRGEADPAEERAKCIPPRCLACSEKVPDTFSPRRYRQRVRVLAKSPRYCTNQHSPPAIVNNPISKHYDIRGDGSSASRHGKMPR